jgi:hypothetical protein
MAETDDFERDIQEAARRRELDRLLRFSVSRDGLPLRWRRAVRFVLFFLILDHCLEERPGAPMLMKALLRSGPAVPSQPINGQRRSPRGRGGLRAAPGYTQ